MSLKIGILAPSSNYIPFIGQDILSALTLALRDFQVELQMAFSGYNCDETLVNGKIQELQVVQGAQLVVAPLNSTLAERVASAVSVTKLPLIVNTLGEDPISLEQHENLFVNSFDVWKSCWLAGSWAGTHKGKRGCMAAAFHDAGYGTGTAFTLGLDAARAELAQVVVTHRESRTESSATQIAELLENQPDFIFCLYSGKEALSFLQDYAAVDPDRKAPLIGLPFMADQLSTATNDPRAISLVVSTSWPRNTTADEEFTSGFFEATGREPHCYALLAYETGLLIARALTELTDSRCSTESLANALTHARASGPRGDLFFASGTQWPDLPSYLCEIAQTRGGSVESVPLAQLTAPPRCFEQYREICQKVPKQGWLNPYLIA